MKPIAEFPGFAARGLIGVLTDIDDTLTTDGRLPADAYATLEKLNASGFAIVPVTGRPAGWCDMVARFWPVAGVVGENGAFYFRYDAVERKMIRRFVASDAERTVNRHKLTALGADLRDFAGCMSAEPAFIATKRGGEGFVEIADRLLSARISANVTGRAS